MTLLTGEQSVFSDSIEPDSDILISGSGYYRLLNGCRAMFEEYAPKNVIEGGYWDQPPNPPQFFYEEIAQAFLEEHASPQITVPISPDTKSGSLAIRVFSFRGRTYAVYDWGEPEEQFPETHQDVVRYLRGHGRSIVANSLANLLRMMQEDPDECTIELISLRDMARFLVQEHEFADPAIGPDDDGIMYAQWRIEYNGAIVMGFPGQGDVLLVAQQDESPNAEALNISACLPAQSIMDTYGHLVPRRSSIA